MRSAFFISNLYFYLTWYDIFGSYYCFTFHFFFSLVMFSSLWISRSNSSVYLTLIENIVILWTPNAQLGHDLWRFLICNFDLFCKIRLLPSMNELMFLMISPHLPLFFVFPCLIDSPFPAPRKWCSFAYGYGISCSKISWIFPYPWRS